MPLVVQNGFQLEIWKVVNGRMKLAQIYLLQQLQLLIVNFGSLNSGFALDPLGASRRPPDQGQIQELLSQGAPL